MDHSGISTFSATSPSTKPEASSSLSGVAIQQFLTDAATRLINFHPYRYQEELEVLLQLTGQRVQAKHVSLSLLRQDNVYQSFFWSADASTQPNLSKKLPDWQTASRWLDLLGTRQVQIWLADQLPASRLRSQLEQDGVHWGVLVGIWQDGVIRGLLRIEMGGVETAVKPIVVLASNLAPILRQLLSQLNDQRRQIALQTGYHLLRSRPEKENLITGILNQLSHLLGYNYVNIFLAEKGSHGKLMLLPFGNNSLSPFFPQITPIALEGKAKNLVQQTAVRRKTIVQNQPQQNKQFPPTPLQPSLQSAIGIPLMNGARLHGVLQIQHSAQNQFSPAEVQTLEIIAEQLSNSLAHIFHRQDQQRAQTERDVLVMVGKLCAEPPSEDELISQITAIIHEALQYDIFGVWLVMDPEIGNLRRHASYRTLPGMSHVRSIIGPGEGISHFVLRSHKAYRISDVQEEPAYLRNNPYTQSKLLVPILFGDSVIGLLDAESTTVNRFSEEDEAFLVAIAKLLSIGFERLRLVNRSSKFEQERQALVETSEVISTGAQADTRLSGLLKRAQQLLSAESCRLYLTDQQKRQLHCVASTGMAEHTQHSPMLPFGHGPIGRLMFDPKPVSLRNPKAIFGTSHQPASVMVAPMLRNKVVVGVLTAERRRQQAPFDDHDLSLLAAIAKQTAVSVENGQLLEQKGQYLGLFKLLQEAARLETVGGDVGAFAANLASLVNDGHYFNGRFSLLLLSPDRNAMKVAEKFGARNLPIDDRIGQVIQTKSAQQISNRLHRTPDGQEVRSAIYLPIHGPYSIIGVALLDHHNGNQFSQATEEQLAIVVDQISILLSNQMAREREQMAIGQQKLLAEMGRSLLQADSLPMIWQAAESILNAQFGEGETAVFWPQDNSSPWPVPSRLSQKLNAIHQDRDQGWLLDDFLRKTKPIILNQVSSSTLDKNLRLQLEQYGIAHLARFPLATTSTTSVGSLIISQPSARPIDQAAKRVASTIAQMLGNALTKQQEQQVTLTVRKQEEMLNRISSELIESTDIPTILATVVQLAAEIVDADSGVIGLLLDQQLLTFYPYNLPPTINLAPASRKATFDWHIIDTLESTTIPNYREHPLVKSYGWQQAELYGAIAVPIVEEIEALGVLKLFRHVQNRPFSIQDLNLIQKIGRQAGIAIKNSRVRAEFLQRIENLSATLAKQEELDKKRNRFVQNVSHELRTPLGIIMGYAELLENGSLGQVAKAQQEPIEIISRRVRMLNQLVNDLSTLLAAETQEFRRDPVSPTQLIEALVSEFNIRANESSVTLQTEIDNKLPWIMGDVNHLRRVFDNLLSNAFKFTSPGGTITIRAWTEAHEVCIEVADSGRGINKEDLARIFERFFLVAGGKHAPKSEGTGLGLSLVKEIVSAHRGDVSVSSEEGKGTTFQIRLPGYDWNGLD